MHHDQQDFEDARDFAQAIQRRSTISLVVARLGHVDDDPENSKHPRMRFLGHEYTSAPGAKAGATSTVKKPDSDIADEAEAVERATSNDTTSISPQSVTSAEASSASSAGEVSTAHLRHAETDTDSDVPGSPSNLSADNDPDCRPTSSPAEVDTSKLTSLQLFAMSLRQQEAEAEEEARSPNSTPSTLRVRQRCCLAP